MPDMTTTELIERLGNVRESLGFLRGQRAAEAEIERRLLDGDPGYLSWLDKLNRIAQSRIAEEELLREQQHMAQQADWDNH